MNAAFIIGTYALLALASLYLVIQTRLQYLIYSLVLALVFFGTILGSLFKILHLTGADELLLVGLAGTVLGAVLLLWKSLRNKQDHLILNKLIVSVIILLQIAIGLFWPEHSDKAGLLNYPVTAFAATVVINEQYEHKGERNMLILFTMLGFLYILMDLLKFL